WHRARPRAPQSMNDRDRAAGDNAAENAEQRESDQLARIVPRRRRRGEQRASAEKKALNDGGSDGADENAAEQPALRGADHFFEREDDAGDRRVENRGDSGRDADRNHAAHELPRKSERARRRGREAARDHRDRPFRSERRAGAEGERR